MPPPTGFSNFSREWEELSLQTKFLAVGSSFGTSVHEKIFHIVLQAVLALKLDKREGAGGGGGGGWQPPPWTFFPYFSNRIKMTFNFNKFWCGVIWSKIVQR